MDIFWNYTIESEAWVPYTMTITVIIASNRLGVLIHEKMVNTFEVLYCHYVWLFCTSFQLYLLKRKSIK